jgi:hypothetical protein
MTLRYTPSLGKEGTGDKLTAYRVITRSKTRYKRARSLRDFILPQILILHPLSLSLSLSLRTFNVFIIIVIISDQLIMSSRSGLSSSSAFDFSSREVSLTV